MPSWALPAAGLQEILQTIRDSTDTQNKVQRDITHVGEYPSLYRSCSQSPLQKLNTFTRVPYYIAYLAHILSAMPQEGDQIRTIAGYLLKNNSRLILSATPEVAEYVKSAVLSAFNDPSSLVRTAAGQDIVAFLGVLEPKNWPDCLENLFTMLDDPDCQRQEVSHKSKSWHRSIGPLGLGATNLPISIISFMHR